MALETLLIAGVAAGATLWQAKARSRAAEAAYPPEGRIVPIDGRDMHGLVMGAAGPDVVLIHGSSGSTRDMTFALAPALAARYRVFVIDRPGLGWSEERPDGHLLSDQARAIRQTAEALGAERPIVLGQSYGGAVALAWALDAPETLSAVVPVSSPSHEWEGGLSVYYRLLSHPISGPVVASLLNAWVPHKTVRREVAQVFTPQEMPDPYPDHFGPRMTLRRASLLANARQRATLKAQMAAMDDHYHRLTMPIEIVHGTDDNIVSHLIHAERLVREAPGAVFTPLPGVGHMPHHVAVDDIVAAVDRAAARAGLRPAP